MVPKLPRRQSGQAGTERNLSTCSKPEITTAISEKDITRSRTINKVRVRCTGRKAVNKFRDGCGYD
jgi:hypothetical protein